MRRSFTRAAGSQSAGCYVPGEEYESAVKTRRIDLATERLSLGAATSRVEYTHPYRIRPGTRPSSPLSYSPLPLPSSFDIIYTCTNVHTVLVYIFQLLSFSIYIYTLNLLFYLADSESQPCVKGHTPRLR